ncbi:hypothetical protein BDV24DRAFT_136234 [Aspergillus arachidicola]|uniref:Uncharacterized protein n=1 Tax=Aspergillus arachidicola TaxID=656916 RepID=A0A5N6Y475_9EURO|nr:hypothetical protein BDV24DRAFT_136234 [Aspergillus arachidicola]
MYNTYIVPFIIFAFSSSLCHYLLAAVQHWFLIPSISFYHIYSASSLPFSSSLPVLHSRVPAALACSGFVAPSTSPARPPLFHPLLRPSTLST